METPDLNLVITALKTMCFLYVTGDSYSENWLAEWKYLYTLARETPNSGEFSFIPIPAKGDYSIWDFGILRITPGNYSDGQRQVITMLFYHGCPIASCIQAVISFDIKSETHAPFHMKKMKGELEGQK